MLVVAYHVRVDKRSVTINNAGICAKQDGGSLSNAVQSFISFTVSQMNTRSQLGQQVV